MEKEIEDLLNIEDISQALIIIKTKDNNIKISYKGKLFNVINVAQKAICEIIDKFDNLELGVKSKS